MKGGLDRARTAAQGYAGVPAGVVPGPKIITRKIVHGIVGGALASGSKRPELAVGFFQNRVLGYP